MIFDMIIKVFGEIRKHVTRASDHEQQWIAAFVLAGREMTSFSRTEINSMTLPNSWNELSASDGFLACLWLTSNFTKRMLLCFSHIPAFLIFSMWTASYRFAKLVKERSTEENENSGKSILRSKMTWQDIYKAYGVVRKMSDMMNNTFGPTLLLFITISMFEGTLILDEIPTTSDVTLIFSDVFWITFAILSLSFAANVCNQVTAKIK